MVDRILNAFISQKKPDTALINSIKALPFIKAHITAYITYCYLYMDEKV